MIAKRILGVAILTHIVPAISILLTILEHEVSQYGYLIPYLGGWLINVFIIAIIGIGKLIKWCFDLP